MKKFDLPELTKEYIFEVFIIIKHFEDDDYLHIGKDKIIILELDNKEDLTNDYLKEILDLDNEYNITYQIKDVKDNYLKAKEIVLIINKELNIKGYYNDSLNNELTKLNVGMFQLYDIYSLDSKELYLDIN